MIGFYPEGNTPMATDQTLRVLNKILDATTNSGGSSGGGGATGVVDPGGSVTADAGSLYYNTVNDTFWVNTDGATAWHQLI